ncbi:hypothetical protein [Hahella ganghwensis]|uniref:hypothetical protein n=1 Tax=Hahella ganghwensis TaxID=286420 RepID=UPI000377428E|nr:hypothetical protein [Hahella ganghwensis]
MINIDSRNKPVVQPSSPNLRQAKQVESTPTQAPIKEREPSDRRMVPDRRRRNDPEYKGSERRRRKDRRKPELLNAKDGSPENISQRRGRLINTSV